MGEPDSSQGIHVEPQKVDLLQNIRPVDSATTQAFFKIRGDVAQYAAERGIDEKPIPYDMVVKLGKSTIEPFPPQVPDNKELTQNAIQSVQRFLGSREDVPIDTLDAYIQNLGVSDNYAVAGFAQLSIASGIGLRKERMQALSDRIQQIKNVNPDIFLSAWRSSKSPAVDKLLILLGNTNLKCAPEEALSLIKNITTPNELQHINSGIFGPAFVYRRPGGNIDIISSKLGTLKVWGNLEGNLSTLLSYGRPESLLKLHPETDESKERIKQAFNQIILHGYFESPYHNEVVDKARRGEVHAPALGILNDYKNILYFSSADNLGSAYYRARVGFFKPDNNGQLMGRNIDASAKLSTALSNLLCDGYTVGLKMSTGGLKETSNSAAVIYIPPFALQKVLSVFSEAGIYDPTRVQHEPFKPGMDVLYQTDPIPFSIRGSDEVDYAPEDSKNMGKYLEENWSFSTKIK